MIFGNENFKINYSKTFAAFKVLLKLNFLSCTKVRGSTGKVLLK